VNRNRARLCWRTVLTAALAIVTLSCKPGQQNSSFFTMWSHYKVGTETDYQLSVVRSGGTLSLPLYYKLVENTPDKVTLELNLPAAQRVTIPAVLGDSAATDEGGLKPTLTGAYGWPNVLYQLPYPPVVKRLTGHESVLIEGVAYDCRFGTTTVGEMKVTQWFSDKVPGGLVKAEAVGKMTGDDPQGTMKLTLSTIKLVQ
jgi:hypothetical protein